MFGFLRGALWGVLLVAAGWLAGSLYPAPAELTGPLKRRTESIVSHIDFSPEYLEKLRAELSPDQYSKLGQDAARLAAQTGAAIIVEHDGEPLDEHMDAVEADQQAPAPSGFEDKLFLCPQMTVTNAPAAGADRSVTAYHKRVNVNGVLLAIAPTHGACLSSGFGERSGRAHKGIDLHSGDGGPIMAAADGVVVEKKYRDDYGNMLLIDHGHGVYTRYAHLSNFARGVDVGTHVTAGQQIGLMGNTASYRIPVHLHYELLLGDYNNPRQSFGLTPHSPFEYPSAG